MTGLAYHGFLFVLLSFTSSVNFVITVSVNDQVLSITTESGPASSAISPTTSPEVIEATEPITSSNDDLTTDDTSYDTLEMHNTTDYDDIDNTTSSGNDSTLLVQLDDDSYNKYITGNVNGSFKQEDSPGTRLAHYAGWSAAIVGIMSVIFVMAYATWRTTTRVSYLST